MGRARSLSGMEGVVHTLHVWGALACFSRPEAKVERLSYPVITPSATRGIFEAIFWQPGLRWQPVRVEVLTPLRTMELRRNEIKQRAPHHDTILRWAAGTEPFQPIRSGHEVPGQRHRDGRTQRQTVALRDVAYRLHARLLSTSGRPLEGPNAQFQRRASRGQCVHQPYFGLKEMACYFRLAEASDPQPQALDLDLGLMLYDVFPIKPIPGRLTAISFFHARLHQGVMEIPDYDSEFVHKVADG